MSREAEATATAALDELAATLAAVKHQKGPWECRVATPDPPHSFWWLMRAPRSAARAQFGPGNLGLGAVWRWDGALDSSRLLECDFPVRWLSLRFDPGHPGSSAWDPFGGLRLWTPRLEWTAGQGLTLRLANADDPGEHRLTATLLQELRREVAVEWPSPPVLLDKRMPEDLDERSSWMSLVECALKEIDSPESSLDKIVLARTSNLDLAHVSQGPCLLQNLANIESSSWPYFLSWPGSAEFLGASPEWLFKRSGRELDLLALAGTRSRSATPDEDARLGSELCGSVKDLHEQAVVQDWLMAQISPLAEHVEATGPPVLQRLSRLQHLASRIRARQKPKVNDLDLLDALHPTPALCGRPREAACQWIRRHEPHDRGLHGGVLGRLEAERAECWVAIRGALLQGRSLRLTAGAGLVAGSRPEQEWDETERKLQAVVAGLCGRSG